MRTCLAPYVPQTAMKNKKSTTITQGGPSARQPYAWHLMALRQIGLRASSALCLITILVSFAFANVAMADELSDFEKLYKEVLDRFKRAAAMDDQASSEAKDFYTLKFMKLSSLARLVQEKVVKNKFKDIDLPKGVNQIVKAYDAASVRVGNGRRTFTKQFQDDLKFAVTAIDAELKKVKETGLFESERDKGKKKEAADAGRSPTEAKPADKTKQ